MSKVKVITHAQSRQSVMADKGGGRVSGAGVKPVQMRLFATGEVEKSTPNCIPRLCSLTLSRLVILKPLENELQTVILAVKMQSSKRILRSNEIIMPPSGLLDTELELAFCLHYPHFLKRDGNKLHIMLQRRKKYKNRTIPGYKTLAAGQVNMAQVLQRSVDRELCLYTDLKEQNSCVAQVMMISLTSQPVDLENGRQKPHTEADRSPDGELSDDDEVPDEQDFSSNEDMSDIEPIAGDDERQARITKFLRNPMRPSFSGRQRNIKQKFIALLKRFKVSEDVEEVLDSEQDQELVDQETNPQDIEDLFDELENLSESDPDIDTISVLSTPKPKLRPFFKGRGSTELLDLPKDSGRLSDDSSKKYDSDSHLEILTDPEFSDSQGLGASSGREDNIWQALLSSSLGREDNLRAGVRQASPSPSRIKYILRDHNHGSFRKNSGGSSVCLNSGRFERLNERRGSHTGSDIMMSMEPRKVLLEQLGAVLHSDEVLPDSLILVNTNDWQGQLLSQVLQEPTHRVICTCSAADVKATITFLVNKIQKFCNTNSRTPGAIKMGIAGGDRYVSSVLRPYVDQFSAKSSDWQNYIKFYIIPYGGCSIGKYLSLIDSKYSSFFSDSVWANTFEKSENSSRPDMGEIVRRINQYMSGGKGLVHLPIAEAMLTFKDKSSEEDSSQIFVPFLNEVRIGPIDIFGGMASSVDLEESPAPNAALLSSSPPQNSALEKTKDNHTPPSSPNIGAPISTPSHSSSTVTSPAGHSPPEVVDLQLDYWMPTKPETTDKSERLIKKDSKTSLKTTFRSVQVYRLPTGSQYDTSLSTLSMTVVTKENKKKIMRIGKKSKDQESKSQAMDGISRLICTSKTQTHPLTVSIDTVEWFGVKFFQLSAQWQTHMKHFPVVTFTYNDNPIS